MPNVRYNLKSEPDPRLIILVFRVDGKKFQYSTGEKVPEKFWDKETCRVRKVRQFPAHRSINDVLDMLEHVTKQAYRAFMVDNQGDRPSWSQLSDHLRVVLDVAMIKDIAEEPERTLFGFIDQFIDERRNSPEYSESIVKKYVTCRNHLQAFEDSTRRKLTFAGLDLNFARNFQRYLFDQGKSSNTVNDTLKQLRTFLNAATRRGIETNPVYNDKEFQVSKTQTDHIYLTVPELTELFRLELDADYLSNARDLFLVGAFTGLRYSDFTKIKPGNIVDLDAGKAIEIVTTKTKKKVVVPLHAIVSRILERNGWEAPRAISNQKMNKYIKEVCRSASWGSDPVLIRENRGGINYDVKQEKWELVTTHTARRSFASNAYLSGVPVLSIMAITGHATEKQLLGYIKVSEEEHARRIAGHDFFKGGLFRVG